MVKTSFHKSEVVNEQGGECVLSAAKIKVLLLMLIITKMLNIIFADLSADH